ncbi:MAG: tRNA pseudouridine(13) synthase TruD [archaeon]
MIIKQVPEDFIVNEISNVKIGENGKYTLFELRKRNYTTERAIETICEIFSLKRKNVGYAGNKDCHAITTQICSCLGNVRDFKHKDLEVKVLGKSEIPITLGDLSGNSFEVIVRGIDKPPEKINYFINYFDEQRFSDNNVEIGRNIVKHDFRKSASLIDQEEAKAHLSKSQNDFIGAIKRVPFKVQTIYINAYQSYLWNRVAASFAIKEKDTIKVSYSLGEFIFTKKEIKNQNIPLLSFDTIFSNKDVEAAYNKIMKEEGITLRDMIIKSIPDITPHGGSRNLVAHIDELEFCSISADELNHGKKKIRIKFNLGKGSYATIALKRMFA